MILLQNYYDGNLPTSTKWRAEEAGKLLPQSKNGRLTMREATLACPNSCNDNAKGPGRASPGPLSVLQAWGGWSRKIKSLNDRRLVASLKFACVQPEGSWRKISQARGVKTKKRFYIWSTSGWGSGERGRKRDARRRKNLLPTRHAFAEKQYLCIS